MNKLVSIPIAEATPIAPAVVAKPIATSDDPIFAAIEAHRVASANWLAAIEVEAAMEKKWVRDRPRYEAQHLEADRATRDASSARDAAAMTFLDIKPTTVAGAAALLNYVGAAAPQTFPEFNDDDEKLLFENEVMSHVGKALGNHAPPSGIRYGQDHLKASANPNPDAQLFALIVQFVAAERKYRELRLAVGQIEDGIDFSRRGPMPDVLQWRRTDRKLGLPPLDRQRLAEDATIKAGTLEKLAQLNWSGAPDVQRIRAAKWIHQARVAVKDHPTDGMFQVIMKVRPPSKAARARADEIIAAYDAWAKPAALPRGFKKLEKEMNRADNAASRLEREVCDTRAATIDGMIAKVRAAHAILWCKPEAIFDTDMDNLSGCAETMADSIFRDLQHFALAEAPLVPTAAT
jgi:hypothetical protein